MILSSMSFPFFLAVFPLSAQRLDRFIEDFILVEDVIMSSYQDN